MLVSPPLPGHLLQVPGESSCVGGKLLASSGTQPLRCQEEVGAADSGTEQGGSGCLDIRADLLGGGTIGPAIWVKDVDPDTAYDRFLG